MRHLLEKETRTNRKTRRAMQARTSRRRGMAVVWLGLTMTVFLGMAAMTVDQGFHLTRKAQSQKAADAAALAGAFQLANFRTTTEATASAQQYAGLNGYTNGGSNAGVGNANVVVTYPVPGEPANYFKVSVVRPERMFFGSAFLRLVANQNVTSRSVGSSALALYETLAPMNINGGGTYGLNDGPATLAMFGPDAVYSFGDCYSTRRLNNGQPNPLYTGLGYDFTINFPATITQAKVDIFDPDCYNLGNIADAAPGVRIDELRTSGGGQGSSSNATVTRYTLYADNGTPSNPSDDVRISSADYGSVSATDMRWTSVFTFDRANYRNQNFRLNATTISGASENGFNIRAGASSDYDGTGRDGGPANGVNNFLTNGTEVTSQGHMPMNFNRTGSATVTLGYVPPEAASKELIVRKFDTDVGATTVVYTCDGPGMSGFSFTGVLSGNGEFRTDNIPIPSYYTGGNWRATYSAALQDTSVWDMSYTGSGPGRPGRVRLIR